MKPSGQAGCFIAEAEKKLDQCIASHTYSEPRIESMCGPGVDPRFDQLISALGHIARQKPRPIIDSLMYWRKAKADYANQARVELSQVSLFWHDGLALAKNVQSRGRTPTLNGHPSRRIAESQATSGDGVDANAAILTATPNNASRQVAVAQADRRSAISVYLLCRVLIEVVGQSTLACITKENEERLEDIIYSQLHGADPESLSTSSIKLANWAIFGQLLGVMSDINFQSVSNRFLQDLEVLQTALNYKGHTNRDHEGKAVLLIHSMRWLRVKSQPEDAWDMSCELLRSLAKFFVAIHGHPVKYAYCQLLEALLLPIAEKANLELNVPKWRDVIDILRPRLNQLLMKPKHWHNAFPLMSVILCVAPLDLFTTQWLQLVLPLQARLKERTTRATTLKAICRLVWRYLYRTTETPNVTAKKLDDIIKLVFQPGKRSYLSTDESIAEPLIQLIRIIGYKHQDLCFRTIIFPLMNAESFLSGRELKVDNLEPERMVIGIRAFLAIMADLEKTEPPPFPVTFESDVFNEPSTTAPVPFSPRPLPHNNKSSNREERLSRPVITSGFGDVAKESYVKFCKILGEITIICDNTFGGQAVLDEKFASQTPKTPMADAFSFSRSRDDHTNAIDPRQGFYDLLHVAVRALPRCLSPHIPFNSLVNLLCTGTAHVQSHVATSSAQSLKSIARQSHAQQVTIGFARFIFNFDDRYSTMSDGGMLGPGHIESTLRLYVELLQIWIEDLKQKTKKAAFDLAEDSNSGSRGAQLDLSGVWAHVDEIESHGLFFLCSPSRRVRSFAVTVLRLVTEFDTALGKDSTRIIRILQGSPQRVMDVNDEKLSVAERSRLQRGMRKSNVHSTLVELCSSDVAYDSTLWFKTYNDDWILNNLITYTKDLRLFLNDAEVQNEWGFQKLRTHYCGLVETLYEGVKKTKDPLRWMPFQSRKAAFALMEDWCGYSPNQNQIRQREDSMRRSVLDREHDMGNKGIVTASMEIEKRDLRTAALSSMAALCGGPVSITTESKVNLQFDVRRMLSWIDTIFDTVSDKTHAIGRRALKNLITHNREHAYLLGRSIEMCYIAKSPKALASYFEVVTQILTECDDHMPPFWRVLCAGLYTLGNDSSEIRMKSVRLLRVLEERLRKSSKLQDLDISVSDKTTAVYKAAQFEVSLRLTKQHAEMAFHVFSEFSTYFKILQPDHQRNMVAAMLPWIQTIELQLDPNGGPTATSYMLLVNLFEITVRCSTALHNEILALWQALATGPHAGNVQLVLDFIINLCLEKKEQNFVDYAKQIVVFLSGTPAGLKVVDFLLLQINPKAMVVEKRETAPVPQDFVSLPYLADLSQVLPIGSGNKPAGLSLGQLCLILLVDLVVSPNKLPPAKVPLLLQVVLVLWDHYTPLVQDQAREMLVHLIHELVISQIDDRTTDPDKQAIEDLIDSIRRHESKVVWSYDDNNGEADNDNDIRVPQAMSFITEEVVKVFAHIHPSLREDWGKMTLTWATSCAVRHIACRSFQIFRCVLTTLDPQMLADMLARLSNTIADDNNDYLTFSMEILTTIKTIIEALEPVDLIKYPQLFWTTAACLDTIFEREFMESLSMLERLLDKLDLSDPAVIKLLIGSQPPKWEGTFEGLQSPVYKGLRSRVCLDRSVHVLDRLTALPSSELVGNDSRLLFAVLANLPRYLRFFEQGTVDPSCISSAELLAGVAEGQGHDDLARALQGFATTRYRADKEFLSQTVFGLRSAFFPEFEYKCLTFLMGLLTNPLPWFRTKTMQLLCVIAPEIDMRKPEITSHGSDLISPLLRLLQTEYCSQALEVLDNIMTMSGTPMDNKHLRMSMAGAHSNRATRKEYESTKCLYGIPEETGWSIPMPAVYSRMTRSNVHAVFYTCASTEATGVEEAATPEIEFHEEYQYSYFPDRTATMMSDDARGDGNMGELVMKLDSLDDFFEDSVSEETLTRQNSHALAAQAARYANGTGGVREDLYDQQTLPILHKSLQHNTSVTSFQTNFGDLKLPPASRDPEVMTPTAFNLPATTTTLARPGLPPRSLTSPGQRDQYQASQPPDLLSGDEGGDEPLSDDDSSIGRSAPSDKSFSLENIIRPGHGLRSNLRSGMRRLTGGGGGGGGPDVREKEKLRDAVRAQLLQKNPRVPKVPDVYLQNPKSADP
ncbi:hypothetical protein B0A49_03704 [Cryomyces minteri]|uniref:Uncharacterized protein n=2 Tax=Cryomyces TaxID=329878 RepID=A0A4U0XII3_9PEZI|nr:hypothetical protein B0A49_03704 [Cryomyces minteri]